jgi:hypothetical protein
MQYPNVTSWTATKLNYLYPDMTFFLDRNWGRTGNWERQYPDNITWIDRKLVKTNPETKLPERTGSWQ